MENEDNGSQDIKRISNWVLIAILIGLLVVIVHQASRMELLLLPTLWGLAFLISGVGIGFLFGIPRIISDQPPASTSASNSPKTSFLQRGSYSQ